MYFDRRVSEQMCSLLAPDGFMHDLVELSRSGQYGLDLQLRADPKASASMATLYVGTTYVLQVTRRDKSGLLSLKAHPTWANKANHWNGIWAKAQPEGSLEKAWPDVVQYLETAIPRVPARYLKEGVVQAGISRYPASDLVVIDRETVVGFTDTAERTRVRRELMAPLMAAMAWDGADGLRPKWWTPKRPGNECDALAIHRSGRVWAIEVKPEHVATDWAPLQARHYADLLQAWADQQPKAAEILTGMYKQRVDVGLADPVRWAKVSTPVQVRAVVAIRKGVSKQRLARLGLVDRKLRSAGLDSPPMLFRRVNLVGRLDEWDLDVDAT